MRRRRRLRARRVAKWLGAVGCSLILAAWTVSTSWSVLCFTNAGVFGIISGTFALIWDLDGPILDRPGRWRSRVTRSSDIKLGLHWPGYRNANKLMQVSIPFWLTFGVAAIPTIMLWRLDRRIPIPGHCQRCGYNLTGNVSGVCPECGTKRAD